MARQMRSLDSYLEEAKAMILKWGSKHWLKDDQIVGQVATAIMRGEHDYNPSHESKATIVTLRITYGRREIYNIYRKINSIMSKGIHYSIDAEVKNTDGFSFADSIEDKSETFSELMDKQETVEEKKEMVKKLLSDSYLTKRQRECLTAKYVEGLTSKEIAERFSVSKQAVSECLKKGMTKLKEIA